MSLAKAGGDYHAEKTNAESDHRTLYRVLSRRYEDDERCKETMTLPDISASRQPINLEVSKCFPGPTSIA
jgi:hypothetical protein